jgi:hypothetical protein
METDMGKKQKNRSIEVSTNPSDGVVSWTKNDGTRFAAEIVIGEDTYLYLTEEEYSSLESQVIDQAGL